MKIDPILSAIIDTADAANAAPDDYINLEDGLKYCGKCHTPKEAYFADNPPFCGIDRHPTECKCAAEEKQQREAERHEFERMSHISLLRSEAFRDISALLILDDLGAERNTSYGKECVFDVVNRRLLSGKPMIITTNITLSAMQKATISMIAVFMTAYWKCVSRSCSTEKTSAKATPLKTSKKRLNC